MTLRRPGALGAREARTQGARVAALRARPRTPPRAAQRGRVGSASFCEGLLASGARPAGDATDRVDAVGEHEPFAVAVHGPQSGTSTGPALRFAPEWIWAAVAAPLRCENVSFHVSVLPVSFAVNDPPARTGSPRGFGTSCLLFSLALNSIGLAECAAKAAAAKIPARPSNALDSNAIFVRNVSPSLRFECAASWSESPTVVRRPRRTGSPP